MPPPSYPCHHHHTHAITITIIPIPIPSPSYTYLYQHIIPIPSPSYPYPYHHIIPIPSPSYKLRVKHKRCSLLFVYDMLRNNINKSKNVKNTNKCSAFFDTKSSPKTISTFLSSMTFHTIFLEPILSLEPSRDNAFNSLPMRPNICERICFAERVDLGPSLPDALLIPTVVGKRAPFFKRLFSSRQEYNQKLNFCLLVDFYNSMKYGKF